MEKIERDNINILYASMVELHTTFSNYLLVFWMDIYSGRTYGFKLRLSAEFVQDLLGIYRDVQESIIIDIISSNESQEVQITEFINEYKDRFDLSDLIIYNRSKKLNELIYD